MINLYGVHFEYDGVSSRKYNLIIANLNTERMTRISGEKTGNFVYNKALKSRYLINDDYTESSLSFDIEIVTCDDRAIEMRELREIENWLFTNSTFKKMYIDIEDDKYGETYEIVYGIQKRLYLNCRFINAEKLEYNNGVIGFHCTIETDGIMLWQDPVTLYVDLAQPIYIEEGGDLIAVMRGDVNLDGKVMADDSQITLQEAIDILSGKEPTFTEIQLLAGDMDEDGRILPNDAQLILNIYVSDLAMKPVDKEYIIIDEDGTRIDLDENTKLVSFLVDSDIDGYTYPEISIQFSANPRLGFDDTVSITNLSDDPDRKATFTNISRGSTLTIDCATHRVGKELYKNMTSRFFPRLVNGMNNILIEGASVTSAMITWQNRRYL